MKVHWWVLPRRGLSRPLVSLATACAVVACGVDGGDPLGKAFGADSGFIQMPGSETSPPPEASPDDTSGNPPPPPDDGSNPPPPPVDTGNPPADDSSPPPADMGSPPETSPPQDTSPPPVDTMPMSDVVLGGTCMWTKPSCMSCDMACPTGMGPYCATACADIITCVKANPGCPTTADPICGMRSAGTPNKCTSPSESGGGGQTISPNSPAFFAAALVKCACGM